MSGFTPVGPKPASLNGFTPVSNSSAPTQSYSGFTPVQQEEDPAPLQDHSPWAFNMTDPTTGRTVPNWLPRGVSNVLFSQTGELMDFFGAEETADKLRQASQDSFGFTKKYDWEDVKEEGIGVLPTIGRGLMYGLESTPTSLGYLGMMAPGMVGGAPAAIVGSAPVFISELERIAQARARADGVEEGIDPTLSQYTAAAPSALANIALDRIAARAPVVSNAGPLKSASLEFGTEAIQGGGEEFATMYGTQSQPDMDVLDAALAEGVAVGPQAAAQAGYAAYRDRFRRAVVEGEGSAGTATQSPFAPETGPMAPPPDGQQTPEGMVETGPAAGLEGQTDVGIPTYGPNDEITTEDPNTPQDGVVGPEQGVEIDPVSGQPVPVNTGTDQFVDDDGVIVDAGGVYTGDEAYGGDPSVIADTGNPEGEVFYGDPTLIEDAGPNASAQPQPNPAAKTEPEIEVVPSFAVDDEAERVEAEIGDVAEEAEKALKAAEKKVKEARKSGNTENLNRAQRNLADLKENIAFNRKGSAADIELEATELEKLNREERNKVRKKGDKKAINAKYDETIIDHSSKDFRENDLGDFDNIRAGWGVRNDGFGGSSQENFTRRIQRKDGTGPKIFVHKNYKSNDRLVLKAVATLDKFKNLPDNFPIFITDDPSRSANFLGQSVHFAMDSSLSKADLEKIAALRSTKKGTKAWNSLDKNAVGVVLNLKKSEKFTRENKGARQAIPNSIEETIAHEIAVHAIQHLSVKGNSRQSNAPYKEFWNSVYSANKAVIDKWVQEDGKGYRKEFNEGRFYAVAEEYFAAKLQSEIAAIAAGEQKTFSAQMVRYLRQLAAYLHKLTGYEYTEAMVSEVLIQNAERIFDPDGPVVTKQDTDLKSLYESQKWDKPTKPELGKAPPPIKTMPAAEEASVKPERTSKQERLSTETKVLSEEVEYTKEEQKTLDEVEPVVKLDNVGTKDWKKTHGTPETWADVDWVNALLLGRGELIPANVKRQINAQIVKANDALIEKFNIDLASLSITGLTGLSAQEAYLEARYRMMGKYLKVDEFAGQIYKTFEKADKADQSQVFDYLTGQIEAEQMNVPDNVKDMAVRLKANIDKNAETLIRMGALRRDTVFDESGGNHYLPRLYLKHVLGEQNYRSLSGGGAMSDQSYTKRRKLIKKGDRVATGKLKGPDGKAYDINDIMSEKERDAAKKRHDLWRIDRDEFLENNQEKLLEMYEAAEIAARKAKAKRNNPDKIFNEDEFDNTKLTDEEKANVRRKVEEKAVPARLREVNEPKVSAHEQSKEEVKAALADQDNSDWTYEYRIATEEEVAKDAPYIEILGEIMDPGYLGASTTSKVGRDIATAEFLIEIANSGNTDWIAPQGMTKIHLLKKEDGTIEVVAGKTGKAVSSIWLRREADILQERIDSGHMTEEAAANAQNVAKSYRKIASDIESEMESSTDWQKVKKQFRQVPDSPKYGVLAGMYINKRIYNDIFSSTNKGEGNKYWQTAEKLHAYFKVAKVPLNPPTVARNVISNYVLMTLDGIGIVSGAKYMVRAFQILKNQNNLTGLDKAAFDAMKKYGIELQTFTSEEMSVINKEFKNLAKQDSGWRGNAFAQAMAISKALNAAGKGLKNATDLYGKVETWQKLAVIRYHMEHGATQWEAVRRAQETLFDYSLLNKGAKAFRKVPVGAPFLSFSLLSLRRFGQVASRNPMRLFHWFALSQLIWAAAATSEDVDDEDLEKLHKGLPEYLADKPSPLMVPLPFRDSHGRMQFLDLAYIHPFGIHWEILKNFAGGDVDEAAETFGITGAPLVQFAIAMSTGLDPFTKQKITEDGYTWGRKMWDRMGFLYSQMTPSIIDFRGDGKGRSPFYKMYEAATGKVGASKLNYGEAKFSMGQAIARLAGINTYGIDPETSASKNLMLMKYKKADLQTAYKRLIRNPNISEEERAKIKMEFEMQMMAMIQDMEEMAELANIHPNLRLKDIKE